MKRTLTVIRRKPGWDKALARTPAIPKLPAREGFQAMPAKPPHEPVIDPGAGRRTRRFIYPARQDNSWNGVINDIEFRISESPDKFGAPAGKATLTKTKDPRIIKCGETTGRYVLVRALSGLDGNWFAGTAEFGLPGD